MQPTYLPDTNFSLNMRKPSFAIQQRALDRVSPRLCASRARSLVAPPGVFVSVFTCACLRPSRYYVYFRCFQIQQFLASLRVHTWLQP